MPRALIYALIFIAWAVFTGAVIYYQDHDSHRAGEHPESDADEPPEPQLSAAA